MTKNLTLSEQADAHAEDAAIAEVIEQAYKEGKAESSRSVVKEWVAELPLKQQAVLLSAVRGCDGKPKEDPSKPLTRAFRSLLFHPADTHPAIGSFMNSGEPLTRSMDNFFTYELDSYPMHWLLHFAHACEIVGYKHPESEVRMNWIIVYRQICRSFHMNVETEKELDLRLGDTAQHNQTLDKH
jgi:hypothetical protein